MTLDDLIEVLRRMRAAWPEMASKPALIMEPTYENGDYSHDAALPVEDVWASTEGVAIAARTVRRAAVTAATVCSEELRVDYERKRGLS